MSPSSANCVESAISSDSLAPSTTSERTSSHDAGNSVEDNEALVDVYSKKNSFVSQQCVSAAPEPTSSHDLREGDTQKRCYCAKFMVVVCLILMVLGYAIVLYMPKLDGRIVCPIAGALVVAAMVALGWFFCVPAAQPQEVRAYRNQVANVDPRAALEDNDAQV